MHWYRVHLKSGRTFDGILFSSPSIQFHMFSFAKNQVSVVGIDKDQIAHLQTVRPLTHQEYLLAVECDPLIAQFVATQNSVQTLHRELSSVQSALSNRLQSFFKSRITHPIMSTGQTLRLQNLLNLVNSAGYQNLFTLQRYGWIQFAPKDESISLCFDNQELPLRTKDQSELLDVLNDEYTGVGDAMVALRKLWEKLTSERTEVIRAEMRPHPTIYLKDIQAQLSERGVIAFKLFHELGFFRVGSNGEIEFQEILRLPHLLPYLESKETFVALLNLNPTAPLQ